MNCCDEFELHGVNANVSEVFGDELYPLPKSSKQRFKKGQYICIDVEL